MHLKQKGPKSKPTTLTNTTYNENTQNCKHKNNSLIPYTVSCNGNAPNAHNLDACQRRFLYRLFPLQPHPHEQAPDFSNRRHRAASRITHKTGRWSDLWAQDLMKWQAHVQREHDPGAWSPQLLKWHGHEWLQLQRWLNSATGESRTNTRGFRGHVYRRWEEGLQHIPH